MKSLRGLFLGLVVAAFAMGMTMSGCGGGGGGDGDDAKCRDACEHVFELCTNDDPGDEVIGECVDDCEHGGYGDTDCVLQATSCSQALSGCGGGGGKCGDVCDRVRDLCDVEDDEFDHGDCVDQCRDELSDQEKDCVLDATSCSEALDCED